jgi:replicative DNA helicase
MNKVNTKTQKIVIDTYLPHNFLAEKMVLSSLLLNSKSIEVTSKNLSYEAFYFKNHQELYKSILFMYKNGMAIDILTLITFLQDNGQLEKVGGIKVIIDLISQIPNLGYLKDYIKLLKDKFIRRSLIKLSYEIITTSHITNMSLEELLRIFETRIFNLANELENKKVFSSAEVVTKIFFELKKKSLNPTLVGLSSGFYELDSLIQGFQKSDLIIIAGRPSMGKTAFSLNIATNILKRSKSLVLFFSLEMSKEQIMYRLLSTEAGISQMRLKSGKLYEKDWLKLNKLIKIIAKLPFFIDDSSNLTIEDIRSKLKTLIFEQKQVGLIIIDYLQLMQEKKSMIENRVQELSRITRSLKILAKEFDVPIIALSQLSRNIETRLDKKPLLSDLRESGSIEQDADLILMLSRNTYESSPNQESKVMEIIVAKQRNGPTGIAKLQFDERRTKFFNNTEKTY